MTSPATPHPSPRTSATATVANSRIAGIGFAFFLVVGFLVVLYAITVGGVALVRPPVTGSAFLDGKTTKQIADALADTPLPRAAAKLERGLSWIAIGDLGPRVRQGCPGWLFLQDELTVHRHADANAAARVAELKQVQAGLAARGIALLVAIVPDKSRVEASHLCNVHRPTAFETRVASWIAALPGVNILPLGDAMRDPQTSYYLRTDTHWNERGAAAAAQAIVARLRRPGDFTLPAATLHLNTEAGAPTARAGDLVRLAGIDWLPAKLQPRADIVQTTRFVEVAPAPASGPVGAAHTAADAATEDDLFGDTGVPGIAVIGTSFSRNSNFIPFLEAALGMHVGNFARDGGEFAGAANAYFSGAAFKDTPPKLVIWEIPERALQRPPDGEPAAWPAHLVKRAGG
jgi:alginate O-acetyltransferase complex protein AlgJ